MLRSNPFPRLWRQERPLCVLTLAYFAAWLLFGEARVSQPDTAGYYAYAQSLVIDGDLAILQELTRWQVWWPYRQVTDLGQARDFFAVGSAVLWLPFVAGAHGLTLLAKALGLPLRADGYEASYVYALSLGSALYAYLALVLSFRTARRYAPDGAALAATLAVLLLTPLFHYALFEGSLSHAADAFAIALLAHHVLHPSEPRERPLAHWIIAGALAGLCTLVRWQNLMFPAAIAIALLARAVQRKTAPTRTALALFAFTAAALLAFAPQLIVWQLQFGELVHVPQGEGFFRAEPLVLEVLLAPQNGLFSWSPITLLATLAGWWLLSRSSRALALGLLACFAAQVYVNASVIDVAGGAACGARRFVGLSAPFVLGLAVFYARAPRRLAIALTALCVPTTLLLWRACELHLFGPLVFSEWSVARIGVSWALASGLGLDRPWAQLQALRDAGAFALPALLAVFAAWSLAVLVALRLRVTQSALLALCIATPLAFGALFALAAMRSPPAPAPAALLGDNALVDFSWYANSRFDRVPALPEVQSPASFHALPPGITHWNGIPFEFREPVHDAHSAASVASTCFGQTLALPIHAEAGDTLHLALSAWLGLDPSVAREVARLRVEHGSGAPTEHVLHARKDVWNVLDLVPPDRQIAWGGVGFVHDYSVTLERAAERVVIEPIDGHPVCLTIFAITLVRASGEPRVVDLGPIANADHGRNPFAPWHVLNHFPSLRPGRLDAEGTTFRLLDWRTSFTGGTTLTTAYAPLRRRIPLLQRPTRALTMLLDGALLPASEVAIARLTVEYDRGADAVFDVHAQRDVKNYELPAAPPVAFQGPPPEDLTLRRWPLDPARTPRFLWIESLPAAQHAGVRAGIVLFALTQEL